jgi:hypothetical protein
MFEFQVYNTQSRHYKTVASGSKDAMILNMTLPHLHGGARRRVRDTNGNVLVKR